MALTDRSPRADSYAVASLLTPSADGLAVVRDAQRAPTGMDPLDRMLGGGFRMGDLVLMGGRPGVGKTILGIQWARAVALNGGAALVASYEHDERTLLARLIALEIGMLELGPVDAQVESIVTAVLDGDWQGGTEVSRHPLVRAALAQVETYAERLVLLPAARLRMDLDDVADAFTDVPAEQKLLVVDYVQKVPVKGPASSWDSEGARVVGEKLKELALRADGAVVAIAAVDEEGLQSRRARLTHLRSAAALSYEADIVIMLNEKALATSRVHLAYDLTKVQDFEARVVFSLEKNRAGRSAIDLAFVKDFQRFRFEPTGEFVAETLIDGVVVEN